MCGQQRVEPAIVWRAVGVKEDNRIAAAGGGATVPGTSGIPRIHSIHSHNVGASLLGGSRRVVSRTVVDDENLDACPVRTLSQHGGDQC